MIFRCSCGDLFEASFVRDELRTICRRCSRFFERGASDFAPAWVDWEPRGTLRVVNEAVPTCFWCQREFKSYAGLDSHQRNAHQDSEMAGVNG